MRIPSGIQISYSIDPQGYRREYYRNNREKLLADCKIRGVAWRKKNAAYTRQRNKTSREESKRKAFALFGGMCAKCGYSDIRALQIDHVTQWRGTRKERIAKGEMGEKLYVRLLKGLADIAEYQLLCANCNWIKRVENGECRRKGK